MFPYAESKIIPVVHQTSPDHREHHCSLLPAVLEKCAYCITKNSKRPVRTATRHRTPRTVECSLPMCVVCLTFSLHSGFGFFGFRSRHHNRTWLYILAAASFRNHPAFVILHPAKTKPAILPAGIYSGAPFIAPSRLPLSPSTACNL